MGNSGSRPNSPQAWHDRAHTSSGNALTTQSLPLRRRHRDRRFGGLVAARSELAEIAGARATEQRRTRPPARVG